MSGTVDPAVALVLRAGFVLLFLGSAMHKIRAPRAFRDAVAGFGVLPDRAAGPAAAVLAVVEIGVVAALVARAAVGAAGAATLLCVYAAAMALALARGLGGIECGCGGPGGGVPLQRGLVARNLVLAGLALALLAPVGARPLGGIDGVTILGALAAATLLFAAAGVLLTTRPRIAELRRVAEGA